MLLFTPKICIFLLIFFPCGHSLLIMVNDSMVLSQLLLERMEAPGHLLSRSRPVDPYLELLLDLDHSRFSGFLLVITNRMRLSGDSCSLFGDLFSVQFNGRWLGLSCSHYSVLFQSAPLRVRLVPALFSGLFARSLLTLVLTAVRFSCPPGHPQLRQCPNHPLFCIPAHLFCNSVDNCGMGMDELGCSSSTPASSSPLLPLLPGPHPPPDHPPPPASSALFPLVFLHPFRSLLLLLLLLLLFLLPIAMSTLLLLRKRRRHRRRWRLGRCGAISRRNLMGNEMDGRYGTMRNGKRKKSSKEAESGGGETVALLTLGLKNVLHSLPVQQNSMEEGDEEGKRMMMGMMIRDEKDEGEGDEGERKNARDDENGGRGAAGTKHVHW